MRSFQDAEGREWDVTVGRESWGTFVLLFSLGSGGEVRKVVLPSESQLEAEELLADLTEDALRAHLAGSEPWEG